MKAQINARMHMHEVKRMNKESGNQTTRYQVGHSEDNQADDKTLKRNEAHLPQ